MITYTPDEVTRYIHDLEERVSALEALAQPADVEGTVTVTEAAQLARVSRRTIYNWVYGKKIRTAHAPSGVLRIYRDTLLSAEGSVDLP